MNTSRMIVLGIAAVAAIAAVLIVRSLMGGGTPSVAAMVARPQMAMAEVLVANAQLPPGVALTPADVRWQKWPKADVDSTFLTHDNTPNLETALTGTVIRSPMVDGEPITSAKFVHADAAGFMAATLQPGMRAVSIPITTETGAGGFILPNDRVDVILSEQISDSPRRFGARVVLTDIRVLAMDQNYKQDRDQKSVLAKTATLELTPAQARIVVRAQADGALSLSLRALGDNSKAGPVSANQPDDANDGSDGGAVRVVRFGLAGGPNGKKE